MQSFGRIVKNNYPDINYFTDELGYDRKRYEMKKEKDRVFPLKYDDVCNLSIALPKNIAYS